MERKERIEILKNKLLPAFESMFWKGEKNHPEKLVMVEALQETIAEAELLDKVASGGIKKRRRINSKYKTVDFLEQDLMNVGFNEAIDLCNAHWVGKMKGIAKVLLDTCEKELNQSIRFMLTENDARIFAKALTNYLTEVGE